MNKIGNEELAGLFTDAASTLRAQQVLIHDLSEKVAAFERRDRGVKIATAMHNKGLELDVPVEELALRFEKAAADELATVERAVDLVGPDMAQKIGRASGGLVEGAFGNSDVPGQAGSSDLERFIVGQAG